LNVVYAERGHWEQAHRKLDAALRAVLGNDIVTTIQRVEMIAPEPGGKVRAFISQCAG